VSTHSASTADIKEAEINALSHPSLPSRKNFFISNHRLQSIFKATTINTTQIKNSPHSAKVLNLALTHHMPASEQQRPDSSVDNKRKPSRYSFITPLLMLTFTDQSITAHHNASQQELPLGTPPTRHRRESIRRKIPATNTWHPATHAASLEHHSSGNSFINHNHITTQLTHQGHSYTISLPPALTYKIKKRRGHHYRLRPSKLKRLNRANLILLNVSALKLEDAKHTDSRKSHSHSFWSPSHHK
jgi:hypothetical protein